MTTTLLSPPATTVRPSALSLRLALTGRAAVLAATALFGTALFPLWLTLVALSPLTLVAPLVLPATWLVRRYADAHRVASGHVLDEEVPRPYRVAEGHLLTRVLAVVRDPASWRDAAWLVAHAVVGFATALTTLVLLLATAFYLIFPFLWAITPPAAFDHQFGFVDIDTAPRAFACMPLAIVAFGLWWALTVPLAKLGAALDRALLRPVDAQRTRRAG